MWRWEDDMRRVEDEKMWRWENDMCRCEDMKMINVKQTPTIRRTLRSDALGKKTEHENSHTLRNTLNVTCMVRVYWGESGTTCTGVWSSITLP
jgi:hypothetical protein